MSRVRILMLAFAGAVSLPLGCCCVYSPERLETLVTGRPVPEDADLRGIAADILDDVGLDRPFWAHRPNPRRLNIGAFSFLKTTRLTYWIDEGRLLAEDKRFRLDHAFTGIHARGGFAQESLLSDAWAVVVDLVGVGVILWVATGVYMWLRDRRLRLWGGVAFGGGAMCFVVLLLAM